ncbi:hypothetical protein GQ43DRAFT_480960 [Delitschia confertaspora ATCC 74209]|uniref:Uncharacterized protein n=1 Tax=Delitschia confertaspora ATCC 74209 TaxID=1513339 RepID=A0A9P4JKQ1_9PLEO|nr:hypothetical protein GQ43DRAFT_480960 [Delitschia confertaspora ATCC 74209]
MESRVVQNRRPNGSYRHSKKKAKHPVRDWPADLDSCRRFNPSHSPQLGHPQCEETDVNDYERGQLATPEHLRFRSNVQVVYHNNARLSSSSTPHRPSANEYSQPIPSVVNEHGYFIGIEPQPSYPLLPPDPETSLTDFIVERLPFRASSTLLSHAMEITISGLGVTSPRGSVPESEYAFSPKKHQNVLEEEVIVDNGNTDQPDNNALFPARGSSSIAQETQQTVAETGSLGESSPTNKDIFIMSRVKKISDANADFLESLKDELLSLPPEQKDGADKPLERAAPQVEASVPQKRNSSGFSSTPSATESLAKRLSAGKPKRTRKPISEESNVKEQAVKKNLRSHIEEPLKSISEPERAKAEQAKEAERGPRTKRKRATGISETPKPEVDAGRAAKCGKARERLGAGIARSKSGLACLTKDQQALLAIYDGEASHDYPKTAALFGKNNGSKMSYSTAYNRLKALFEKLQAANTEASLAVETLSAASAEADKEDTPNTPWGPEPTSSIAKVPIPEANLGTNTSTSSLEPESENFALPAFGNHIEEPEKESGTEQPAENQSKNAAALDTGDHVDVEEKDAGPGPPSENQFENAATLSAGESVDVQEEDATSEHPVQRQSERATTLAAKDCVNVQERDAGPKRRAKKQRKSLFFAEELETVKTIVPIKNPKTKQENKARKAFQARMGAEVSTVKKKYGEQTAGQTYPQKYYDQLANLANDDLHTAGHFGYRVRYKWWNSKGFQSDVGYIYLPEDLRTIQEANAAAYQKAQEFRNNDSFNWSSWNETKVSGLSTHSGHYDGTVHEPDGYVKIEVEEFRKDVGKSIVSILKHGYRARVYELEVAQWRRKETPSGIKWTKTPFDMENIESSLFTTLRQANETAKNLQLRMMKPRGARMDEVLRYDEKRKELEERAVKLLRCGTRGVGWQETFEDARGDEYQIIVNERELVGPIDGFKPLEDTTDKGA